MGDSAMVLVASGAPCLGELSVLASHRWCHADSQHGFCERAQTPGSVSGGVPGRGLDPSGRAANA